MQYSSPPSPSRIYNDCPSSKPSLNNLPLSIIYRHRRIMVLVFLGISLLFAVAAGRTAKLAVSASDELARAEPGTDTQKNLYSLQSAICLYFHAVD